MSKDTNPTSLESIRHPHHSDHVPFFRPDIGKEEIEAVSNTLASGWLTTGKVCAAFESDFARYLGADKAQQEKLHCIAVNSATAALHLSVEAIGIKPGDEVLVPTWTFTSTAEVVRYMGATPVFVDCNPHTLCIDFDDAQQKVTPRTKAVLPVHFAGLPVGRSALAEFAQKNNLHVVEDAAHCFPVMNEGAIVGNVLGAPAAHSSHISDTVCFSFYATKTMTTGEGGMVVTSNDALAQRMKTMRLHGISHDVFDRYTSKGASWYYEVVAPGYKYNLTDIAAALGRVQLTRAQAMAHRRCEIAKRYCEALADLPVELPASSWDKETAKNSTHSWHLFEMRILPEAPLSRNDFIDRGAQEGMSCSVHFIPIHMQPYYRETFHYQPRDLPVAYEQYQRAVSLPLFSAQTDEEVERVIAITRKLLS